MPWYGWVVLIAVALFALTAIALRIFRASRRGRRFMTLSVRGKIDFARAIGSQPGTPFWAKALVGGLAFYLALPFDLIPDFVPVLGQLDDTLVTFVVIGALIAAVPRERFAAALHAAERGEQLRARDATSTRLVERELRR